MLPAADGKAASVSLAPPLYVPGRSARLLPAGVRGAGPPAAPAYVYERTCEVGGAAAPRSPRSLGDRDPRSLWDGAWAVPIKCFRLSAVLCGTDISEASERVGSSQFLMSLYLI